MNVFKLCVAIVSLFTVVSCSNEDLENVLGQIKILIQNR